MRALNARWAALLVVSAIAATPVLAVAAPAPSSGAAGAASVGLRWPSSGALGVQSTEHDKKKAAKKKETIAIRVPSSTVKRGDKGVEIVGKTSSDDRNCEMTIKWNDGKSTDVQKVRTNNSRECVFTVDIPRGDKVQGEASIAMKSLDGKKKLASASRIMHVE